MSILDFVICPVVCLALLQAAPADPPMLGRQASNQDIFSSPLATLSPLNVEFNGHRFSAFEADIEAAEQKRKLSGPQSSNTSSHFSSSSSPYSPHSPTTKQRTETVS